MSHVHTRHSGSDNLDLFTQEFWDARYRSADRIWSGNPNPHLVAHVAELFPRTALDVGCGEGADTIWLASLGWHVTAIDVSTVLGHHPSDLETTVGRPNLPDLFFTAEEVAAALHPDDWQIIVAAAPERQTLDPDGHPVTIRDAVMRAIRRE
jgi:trans-aconitate methyltransferase